jgi:hypothetical protein
MLALREFCCKWGVVYCITDGSNFAMRFHICTMYIALARQRIAKHVNYLYLNQVQRLQ